MRILSRAEFFRETPGLQIILFSKVYITALRKSLHAHHLRHTSRLELENSLLATTTRKRPPCRKFPAC